jgi:glycerol dehydrogenase
MGDTLAKWLEAYNFFGSSYASVNEILGVTIARQAWDLIFAHYREAYTLSETAAEDGGRDIFTDVIDGVFFLAGLIGSIRGGKHIASYVHPLNDAFTRLEEGQKCIHGEVVSFANAVQLALFRQDDKKIHELLAFNKVLGLPLSLDDLGFEGKNPEQTSHRLSAAFDWNEAAEDQVTPFAIGPAELEEAIVKVHFMGKALT